jgi:cell division septal protein FtsQ
MSPRQRKTAPSSRDRKPASGTSELGAATGERWRQPPPEPRAKVRRHQTVVQKPGVTILNPLVPVVSRGLEFGQSLTVRHWITLIVVVAAAVGLNQLLTLDAFTVTAHNVLVRGNQRASTDEIYAASSLEGTNVFRVRAESTSERISEVPGIASAQIHLRLPARVIIDVQELKPLAIVQTITETLWVGADGTGIQQAGEPPNIVLVEDSGEVRDASGALLPEIIEGLEAIRAQHPELTEVHYGALEGLYLRAPEGYTIYLGAGGAMARKLALLEATQQQIAEEGLHPQVVDLRFDGYAMLK